MSRITRNFTESEFACKCRARGLYEKDPFSYCGGLSIYDHNLVAKLQFLRDQLNSGRNSLDPEIPVIVDSGYRCPAYNRRSQSSGQGVSGAMWSQHMLGKAADIRVPGHSPEKVAKLAEELGFSFIGIYNTFTHVDVRSGVDKPVVVDYRKEK